MELSQGFLTPLWIVQRELGDFSLHLQRRQRAAQLVGGISGKPTLAQHDVVGALEQLIQRLDQRADFSGDLLHAERFRRVRRAQAQRARQMFQRRQFAA